MSSELQKEIKQTKPFESLEEEVYLNLQRTAYMLATKTVEILKRKDLTPTQYNALRILRGAGENGLTCSEVSMRMVTNDSDITRLLERLESRGLICRVRAENDRRVIIARITSGGLDILGKLDDPVAEMNRAQLGHLGQDLLEQLNALLVLARKNAQ